MISIITLRCKDALDVRKVTKVGSGCLLWSRGSSDKNASGLSNNLWAHSLIVVVEEISAQRYKSNTIRDRSSAIAQVSNGIVGRRDQ